MALVMSVVYAGRSLPIAWLVVEGNKGHLGQDLHLQLVNQVRGLIPEGVRVVFLGDGEFDGTWLQSTVRELGWQWVVRTACNSQYLTPISRKWHNFSEWHLQPG